MNDAAEPDAGAEPRRRPRQLVLAAVILVVFGALTVVNGWALQRLVDDSVAHGQSVPGVVYGALYLQYVLGLGQILSAVFVWQGREWARIVAIVVCSVNILTALLSLVAGALYLGCLGILVNAGLIRILTLRDVVDWCRRRH